MAPASRDERWKRWVDSGAHDALTFSAFVGFVGQHCARTIEAAKRIADWFRGA